jgi:uncharacterized membrane protein
LKVTLHLAEYTRPGSAYAKDWYDELMQKIASFFGKYSWVQKATLIVLLLALVMRLPLLNGSFWLDEAAQVVESNRPLNQQLQIQGDFQPPLIHLLVYVLLLVSPAEWWLRTGAALIPGLVTIWAVIKVAENQNVRQPKSGLLAALLLATSSLHIFYSQELRPYSLPTMFAGLSWLTMLNALSEKDSRSRRQHKIWWAVWTGCGLYSSFLYPFALIGQFAYLAINWKMIKPEWRSWGVAGAAGIASFFPWLPFFVGQLQAGQALRTQLPGWENIVSYSQFKSLALIAGKFIFGVLDLQGNAFFIGSAAVLFIVGGVVLVDVLRRQKNAFWQMTKLFVCWMIIPIAVAWVISFIVPILQPKRVLFALPIFYLWIAFLATEAFSAKTKLVKIAAAALVGSLLLINLFSAFSYYLLPKYQRENWRDVHKLIVEKYDRTESTVVFAFPYQFASWEWYNQFEQFPTYSTGVFVVSPEETAPDRVGLKRLATSNYILVFDYLRDLTDPQRIIDQDLQRYGFKEVDRITPDTPLGIIRVYARTGQILSFSEYSATDYENRN